MTRALADRMSQLGFVARADVPDAAMVQTGSILFGTAATFRSVVAFVITSVLERIVSGNQPIPRHLL